MAVITLEFADIKGESTLAGYEGQADAVAIRDSIEMPLVAGSGRTRAGRSSGTANHSDIELARFKDIASPKLAEACSSGTNIGDVTMNMFRMLEAGLVPYMTFKLRDVFVSRVEFETLDENGGAFLPHMSDSSLSSPPPNWGASGAAESELRKANGRLGIRPVVYQPRSSFSNQEVERLYLNPSIIVWEYNQYIAGVKSGSVAKGWDVERNTEALQS